MQKKKKWKRPTKKMFKEKYITESNENESKRDQEKKITFDDFYKNTKIKRTYSAHCAHKGKGGSIKPCRTQEAGGLFRHQQK